MSIAHKLAIASFLTMTALASAQGRSTSQTGVGYSPEHPALDAFRESLSRCTDGVEAHRLDAATAAACTRAADLNNHIQSSPHFNDSLQANQLAAISLAGAGEYRANLLGQLSQPAQAQQKLAEAQKL